MTTSSKLEAPAAERNKEPIWKIWQQEILEDKKIHNNKPDNARQIPSLSVLEIAAGTGAHAHYFCTQLLAENKFAVQWQPVDADARYRASVQAYIDEAASSLTDDGNRRPQQLLAHVLKSPLPLTLDEKGIVEVETQRILQNGETKFDVIYCANMIHIAPYAATVGLMQVASEYLAADGVLFLYGPYKVNGDMVESNRNFDASLRQRNPEWGIRDLESVQAEAEKCGLQFIKTVEMPANNLVVLFRKVS